MFHRRSSLAVGVLMLVMCANRCGLLFAEEGNGTFAGADDEEKEPVDGRQLVPVPTLGGKQFWADELHFHRWRIQRNVLTGSCRLLDAKEFRHATGTFAECRAVLDRIKRERRLPAMQGKGVVVLHGLGDSRAAMDRLCDHLAEEGRYCVFNVTYPSTRRGIAEHAAALAGIVANLEGIEEINFVGFSMGNLIIRHYLADQVKGIVGPDPRIKRFAMLAPPNHGAEAATALAGYRLFQLIAGTPGQELGRLWVWKQDDLGTPRGEFGVIAGGLSNGKGFNPFLPGDDDGIVTLESTRLVGACDFVIVPLVHSLVPRDPKVHQYVLRFLDHGYFIDSQRRSPIREDIEK